MTTQPQIDGRDLGLAFQATTVLRDRILAKNGWTFPEFVALRILTENPQATRAEYLRLLERVLLLDEAQAEDLVRGLDGPRMLRDGERPALTPTGRRAFEALMEEFANTTALVYAGIDAEAIATTRNVLHQVQEQAEALAAAQA